MKRHAPATERNREPIAEVLARELPPSGTVLEIASGSGEHAVFFARRFPNVTWLPSDCDAEAVASIAAYRKDAGLPNFAPPLQLDICEEEMPVDVADAIFCANMIHISPWASAEGLFHHGGRLLPTNGPLILYGPFIEPDRTIAESNLAFDQSLKMRDPRWGLRSLDDVDALAAKAALKRTARHEMPANNLMVVYRRT